MINKVFMLDDIFKLDKEKLNKTGIYCIFNVKNDKYYVGQTTSSKYGGLFKRLRRHVIELRKGYHYNILLQRSFDKYGEDSFRFKILEICNEKDLNNREIYWGTLYNSLSPDGYNFMLGEQDVSISSCFKQKMSKYYTDISGYNSPTCKWAKIDDFGMNRIVKLKDSGLGMDKIVNIIGISKSSFYKYLSYHDLSWKKIGKYSTLLEKIDDLGGINKIIELKESGKSRKDVSLFFNVSPSTLDRFLKKNNVKWSTLGKTLDRKIDDLGGIKKIIELKESGKSRNDVCLFFDITSYSLYCFLKKSNIKWSDLGKYGDKTSFYHIDCMGGIKKIIELKESSKNKNDICLFFNISAGVLDGFLKENNVKWSNLGKYSTVASNYKKIDDLGGINSIIKLKESGKTKKEVCLFFNISDSSLDRFLKKNHVKWSNLGKYGNHTSFYYIDSIGGMKKINSLIKKGYMRKEVSDIMKINQETLREYIDFHKTPEKGRILND